MERPGTGGGSLQPVYRWAFELVTNRNLPAQNATSLLKDSQFVKNVAEFLNRVSRESGGEILRELVNRIRREATAVKENEYITKHQALKEGGRSIACSSG